MNIDGCDIPGFGYKCVGIPSKITPNDLHQQMCVLQVYKNFVEAVDAIDNGVSQFDCDTPARQVLWDKVPTRAPLHVPNY